MQKYNPNKAARAAARRIATFTVALISLFAGGAGKGPDPLKRNRYSPVNHGFLMTNRGGTPKRRTSRAKKKFHRERKK